MSDASIASLPTYEIKTRDLGSPYSRFLYDVDGRLILDSHKHIVNVYSPHMKEMFEDRSLRLIRSIKYGYVYFVQSEAQRERFTREREDGSRYETTTYYVYKDKNHKV